MRRRVSTGIPGALLLTMCAVFVCFSLSPLLSGVSRQDYSSILLSLPDTIAKRSCVLSFPLAFSVPRKANRSSTIPGAPPHPPKTNPPPPLLRQGRRKCPLDCHLCPTAHLTTAGTFGLLISAPTPPPSLNSLSLSFVLTNSCVVAVIVASHLTEKKNLIKSHYLFAHEEITRTFLLSEHPFVIFHWRTVDSRAEDQGSVLLGGGKR